MSKIDLFNGDCLEKLKGVADNSIDCIITDPPYKITQRGACGTMSGYWTTDIAKKGKIFKHNDISCKEYLPEFYRVLKDKTHCYIMCNNINLVEIITEGQKCGFNFVKRLIWEKGNKICGRYYMNAFEYIVLFRKGGDRPINFCGTSDILKIPIKKLKDENGKNLHDTEKPVELARVLIENSTQKGEIVLDPFMGIGWTAIASREFNRQFIGCELDEKYFNVAKNRIEKPQELTETKE